MCGRFTLTIDVADLQDAFPQFSFPSQYTPHYNIAPTQPVLVIPNDGKSAADFFIWGLVPSWAKDPTIGARLINARAETLTEKPSFRGSFKYRRCIIPADGFYEWKSQPGTKIKVPYFIHLKPCQPFAFAGLWDEWQSPDGSRIRSCTIITTQPNALMATLHDRMPVLLPNDGYTQWLDPSPGTLADLQRLLTPFPAEKMDIYPVSSLVNNPTNDSFECTMPKK